MKLIPICLLAPLLALPAFAAVEIKQAADRSVRMTTGTYAVRMDPAGNITELSVKGEAALTHDFGDAKTPPAGVTVNVINDTVAVRAGALRDEWTFAEDRISFLSEGYRFECLLTDAVRAALHPQGKGGPVDRKEFGYANCSGIALANGLTIMFAKPHHVTSNGPAKRILPSHYTNGGGKVGALFESGYILGAPADAAGMISGITVREVGGNWNALLEDGNQGSRFPHFTDAKAIAFTSTQVNAGREPMALEYRLSVRDHYVVGKEITTATQQATLPPGNAATAPLRWSVPEISPGFYYLSIAAWRGDAKISEAKVTFTVNLPQYRHPTTAPADFAQFWQKQNQRLTDTPLAPKLELISPKDAPHKVYAITLAMPGGKTVEGFLTVPAKIGPGPARFSSTNAQRRKDYFAKAAQPGFEVQGDAAALQLIDPGAATFTRWVSAEDNNLLDCILVWLRGVDYLTSRPDVKPGRIKVTGASRSGPLAFITAALRPRMICGVDTHVGTSAGISWTDKPYLSWGTPPNHKPENPEAVAKLAAMSAYVDPVNHAPYVHAPFLLAYGVDDGLAQPQGIEVMYQLAPAKWKRISRDAGGHAMSPGYVALAKELATLLGTGYVADPGAAAILREH